LKVLCRETNPNANPENVIANAKRQQRLNKLKMEKRPKMKLALKTVDKIFEIVGWGFIIMIWVLTITSYSNLPETIPTHYNGAGQADGFGGKATILTLPLIATILFIGLTVLNKFPQVFNYPTEITQDNAFRQYIYATRLIRYLKLIIVFILGLIEFKTIQNANGEADGLGVWFLPLTMGVIFIPMIYFILNHSSLNNDKKPKHWL
jgi:uncharacterized membrane protein